MPALEGEPRAAREPAEPLLSLRHLTKAFGGTLAVSDVSFDVRRGEILALLGQNGAGKSTIIKVLAGVYRADSGSVTMNGTPFEPGAERSAIAFIHQDLGLVEWMTVAENIALAQGYPRRFGLVDWAAVDANARRSLSLVAHDIDPRRRVSDLTRTEKSLVAIARALGVQAQILVLDEPTASLPQSEVERLFGVLRRLRADGVSMIYVSHRLDEVFAISNSLVVLRDGRLVDARPTADADGESLIASIIGRRPESVFVRPPVPRSTPLLSCEGFCVGDVGPVSFTLREGEILALVGLRGAGQESIGRGLIGIEPATEGHVMLRGSGVDTATPSRAMASRLGFVAADRVMNSIAGGLSVRENMFINPGAAGRRLMTLRASGDEAQESRALGRAVGLSPNNPAAAIDTLSGGNQQKVVMARWMRISPEVLVLEDPTAGVDVGAKAEIYRLLAQMLKEGRGVILISTDFDEVAAICHRALVFRGGQILTEIATKDLSLERLTHAASLATRNGALSS